MKKLMTVIGLVLIMCLLVPASCAAPSAPMPAPAPAPPESARHPEGMKSLRWLTDAEKDKVIEIALNTSQALKQLEKYSHYETNLSWIAIVWDSSEYEYSEWRGIDYEWETDDNLRLVSASAEFYSRVVINFGEPPRWQVSVAVNPDTEKVALVEENPFRTGPTPPKDAK